MQYLDKTQFNPSKQQVLKGQWIIISDHTLTDKNGHEMQWAHLIRRNHKT